MDGRVKEQERIEWTPEMLANDQRIREVLNKKIEHDDGAWIVASVFIGMVIALIVFGGEPWRNLAMSLFSRCGG